MSDPETSGEQRSGVSSVDYEALHAEALSLNHETFLDRAERESDPKFAKDLRFSAQIAQQLAETGGLALAVGGYARDAAIARETGKPQKSKDIDIEVYGVAFEDLKNKLDAFGDVNLVGSNFGVAKLTNPATGSVLDFSIPREDSKVDKGHGGFRVTGNPNMTVREAARRRDLTINALALNPLTGELVDEYGGLQDIKDGVLRATDHERFADDPLRVLRVMQFAGRFGYKVEPETAELCRGLDLTELPRERVGEEWVKLMTKSPEPSVGLEVARDLGVLEQLHPELAVLDKIEQEPDWHPEGNVWNHTKLAADAAAWVVREEKLEGDDALVVLFGALCHDLGKATTTMPRPKQGVMRITAHGHEVAGVEPTKSFLDSLNMKHGVTDKIIPIIREHLYHVHNPDPTDKQLGDFAKRLSPANIWLWDLIARCDANGRQGDFVSRTKSSSIYDRSRGLNVAEKPAEPVVTGDDLIERLGLKPGPELGLVLDYLYDAQLGGAVKSVEEGIAVYHANKPEIDELVKAHVDRLAAEWLSKRPGKRKKRKNRSLPGSLDV